MYTLKEGWIRMHGDLPFEDWDGKICCTETDAAVTFRTHHWQGLIDAYTFTLVTEGSLTIACNGRELTLEANDLYISSPGLPVSVVASSENYHALCLLVDGHTMPEVPAGIDLVRIACNPVVKLHEPKLRLSWEDAGRLAGRMRETIGCLYSRHVCKSQMLCLLYGVFLLDLQDAQARSIGQRQVSRCMEDIFFCFMRLLPYHFIDHHDIGFYALRLNISVTYLSRVLRQVTGRTVIDHINRLLLTEASFLLSTSSLTIAQVADRLHFADTPSFSKFFLRMKGMTPRQYTQKYNKSALFHVSRL